MTSASLPSCAAFANRPFYLMRHGETVSNEKNVIAGIVDTPLTEKGREQARATSSLIAQVPVKPSAVFHSHLSRARETAQLAAGALNVPFFEEPLIGERDVGAWAGLSYEQYKAWRAQGIEPPGGESVAALHQRVDQGFTRILSQALCPLIVSHGGIIRAFGELFDLKLGGATNCALYFFEPEAAGEKCPWRIERVGRSAEGNNFLELVASK